jgi:omega-6 fatty acid desaturase (delta-12 desaturase)
MDQEAALRRARLDHSKRSIALPVELFVAVLLALSGIVIAALASPLLIALPLALAGGVQVSMLFVIGHDACHQSYTSSRTLNNVIGRIAFLIPLHPYSLWDFEHNHRHHRHNNIRHLDLDFAPMTPEDFACASAIRRITYRFFRSPAGVPFYYLLENWPARLIIPRRKLLGKIRLVHVADVALVWGFLGVHLAVLTLVGGRFGKGAIDSIVIGFLIPFLVFNAMISAAIFLHHTHPKVPWYADVAQWERENGRVHGVVHVVFPWIVRKLLLHIMEHGAHHYAPGVPLYKLDPMQNLLDHAGTVSWPVHLRRYLDVCRYCKLFDYEQRKWIDFSGNTFSNWSRSSARSLRKSGRSASASSGCPGMEPYLPAPNGEWLKYRTHRETGR